MEDSGLLLYAADHDSNRTSPCDDFKTFATGEFFEHRVLNDRYPGIGFAANIFVQYWEKQKRMLLKPTEENDLKVFKLMKSYYRQCINFSKRNLVKL